MSVMSGGKEEGRRRKIEFGSRDVAHRMHRHRPQEALTPSLHHLLLMCVYVHECLLCALKGIRYDRYTFEYNAAVPSAHECLHTQKTPFYACSLSK